MSDPLVSPRILFRFAAPCLHRAPPLWTAKGIQLDEDYALPSLAELDGCPRFADVRVGWHETGLAVTVRVQGKKQQPWCRDSQMDASDGLHLWIDTRDTKNIHRAGRFCHRFAFLPQGSGGKKEDPTVGQLLINRAREHPKPADPNYLKVRSEKRVDGYLLECWIGAGALTGFDPRESPRLGFHYAVLDRELGNQTFAVGDEFPYEEDPSLWGTLELLPDSPA
jgi:hypothetical protein